MYRYALRHERIVLKCERAAFLIPCQGLRGYFAKFQYPKIVFWLLWCKWHNNDVFHTNNFWNQDILYKNSLICSFYENSYFQSIQIPCFCIFFAKNSDFNTKAKKLASLHTNLDLTRRSTTLTLNSTKTCERAGKSKISVLETHYFFY